MALKRDFEYHKWASKPVNDLTKSQDTTIAENPLFDKAGYKEAESVIKQIEENKIDIAFDYRDWLSVGFAFADAFGETGRELYHRISQFYPLGYNQKACDRQYDQCLKANGSGITLASFFYLAKRKGVSLPKANSGMDKMPTFPEGIYENLPVMLQKACVLGNTPQEKDLLLLGSLATLSSCLPGVYGVYLNKKSFVNLFLFVTANASAGKGPMVGCRRLITPIHQQYLEESRIERQRYEMEMTEYNAQKKGDSQMLKPEIPKGKLLLIPADNSSTGMLQLICDNGGQGLVFETEGDTLSKAFNTDYGNYSDTLRKAFHHEPISFYRRVGNEYAEILEPSLSLVLSGTPRQVSTLMPDVEDGLFSRFIFYRLNGYSEWQNAFASSEDIGEYFDQLAKQFYPQYKRLESATRSKNMVFTFSESQKEGFNEEFKTVHDETNEAEKARNNETNSFISTIRRMGVITFRVAMILTTLRFLEEEKPFPGQLVCNDDDFNTAMDMAEVLLTHSEQVFQELEKRPTAIKDKRTRFCDALPTNFTRQGYQEVASDMGIAEKTADKWVKRFL